jgi:hypothetical protein
MTGGPQETGAAVVKTVAPTYAVRPGSAASERDRIADLWKESGLGNLDGEQRRARFDWFYLLNPQGEGDVSFLHLAPESPAVGFLGVGRRDWVFSEQTISAGVLVDFVVHPDHRTAAPALMLQRNGRERAQRWAGLLLGLPDVKAVAVFKRLGGDLQGFLPRYVRILRYQGYLRRRLPSPVAMLAGMFADGLDSLVRWVRLAGFPARGAWKNEFDASFDDLWQRLEKQGLSVGVRNSRFLSWRFGQQPGFRYRTFVVERPGGSILAYFVCNLQGDTLEVKDVLGVATPEEYAGALLMLLAAARKAGAAAVSIQVFGDDILKRALRRVQFVERDKRPVFCIVGPEFKDRVKQTRWYITQADEDI